MESFALDLSQTKRVPLTDVHVAAIRDVGEEVHFAKGEIVGEVGDPMDRFIYILEGGLELIDPYTREAYLPNSLGPGQFAGEMGFLYGGTYVIPVRAREDTNALVVPRQAMLELMARVPEMGDIIVDVFNGRRRRQLEAGDSSLTVIGAEDSKALRQIEAFASRSRIAFRSLTLGSPEAKAAAAAYNVDASEPVVIFGQQGRVSDPTPRKIAALLGLDLSPAERSVYDVLIVGGGPAGVAAGVYAGAEGLHALVVDEIAIGGQAGTSSRIENYMGFPTGVSGADLLWRGEVQAMRFGTEFVMPHRVEALTRQDDGTFAARLDDGKTICATAAIIATGVQYRKLPLERLADFEGAGIYYAATEAEARFCGDSEVVIIGGGNSAGQAAMFLCRSAKHVHVLVRGHSLAASMSDYLSSRLEAEPSITVHYRSEVVALRGDGTLASVTVRDKETDKTREIGTNGLFIMVGAAPNTDWLSGLVELDEKGFVLTGPAAGRVTPFQTSAPGIFAVGDVRAGSVKRVASAVGEGSVVVSQVWSYMNERGAQNS